MLPTSAESVSLGRLRQSFPPQMKMNGTQPTTLVWYVSPLLGIAWLVSSHRGASIVVRRIRIQTNTQVLRRRRRWCGIKSYEQTVEFIRRVVKNFSPARAAIQQSISLLESELEVGGCFFFLGSQTKRCCGKNCFHFTRKMESTAKPFGGKTSQIANRTSFDGLLVNFSRNGEQRCVLGCTKE